MEQGRLRTHASASPQFFASVMTSLSVFGSEYPKSEIVVFKNWENKRSWC